jgi:hypothetical protein
MSMPELKRVDPERAGRSNRGGGWLGGAVHRGVSCGPLRR